MNKTLLVLLVLPFTFLGISEALAQSSLKGQGRAFTGAGIFSMSADARGSRGGGGGSFRYDRKANGVLEELVVVAAADCLWTSLDGTRAVVSGRADVRANPAGLATKEWFYIGIQDAGPAEKNRASAGFVSMAEGLDLCQTGLTSFPAMVDIGDFVITRDVSGSGDGSGVAGSGVGGGGAGGPAGAAGSSNLAAPPFDGALYIPFDGTAAPGQIVTKPGATPPTFVPGKYGQAIYISDSSAVAVPFQLSPVDTPQITMTAWIKYSRRAGIGKIISTRGTGHPVLQVYGGRPKLVRAQAGRNAFVMTVDGSEIDMNTWTFVAGIFDYDSMTMQLHAGGTPQLFDQDQLGNPLRMKLNSSDVGTQTEVTGPDGEKGYYITIGANEFTRFGGVSKGYAIDDVRIYTRALSEQAIAGLAGGGTAPDTAPSRYADIPVLVEPDPIGNFDPREALARPGASTSDGSPLLSDPRPTAADPTDNLTLPEGLASPQEELEAAAEASRKAADRRSAETRLLNEAEAARREAETEAEAAAAAEAAEPTLGEPYPMAVWNYSAIAGVSGSIIRDADLGTSFMNKIAWDEVGDMPCRLEVSNTEQDDYPRRARLSCSRPATDRPTPPYKVSLPSAAIGRLSICSNNRGNQRLKGIRVWGSTINPDGSLTYSATDEQELPNCSNWSGSVLCPDDMSASGIRVHANYRRGDKTEIVGLQLICRKIGLR